MKLPLNLRFDQYKPGEFERLMIYLSDLFSRTNEQVNRLTEGKANAVHNATTAAPTTGTYATGDFVRNSAPAELGSVGSKYVIYGFLCVAGGTPGTWVQCRFLTGA